MSIFCKFGNFWTMTIYGFYLLGMLSIFMLIRYQFEGEADF